MSIRHLDSMFAPSSVAVIGASDRPGSVGAVLLRNLREGGFAGPVWPVNAAHDEVGGGPAWRSVAALPAAPALAVICTPAPTVPGLVAELGARGTRAAIVLSAGLRQRLQEGGPTIEQAMLDAARPHLLRILGPNCIGALVPAAGLNASFAPGQALAGKLAFVTQSGALATAMLDWARGRGIGFSHFVSLGDSADVDFGDLLDYLASDASTRAILLYMESIKGARKFMSAARAASRNKPVLVVKAGRAPAGARAAASHTGALAGSDAVFDAALARAGMLRVDTLEDLFDAAETLARARPLAGERLALLTNGGGAGVLAADALALGGGALAELAPATLAALDACLPPTWSHGNPVDIIGDAPVARYGAALQALLDAQEVDGVLFKHAPTAIVPAPAIAQACLPWLAASAKPVLTCWLGGPAVQTAREQCAAAGLPGFATPERAVRAWLQLAAHARNQQALRQLPAAALSDFAPERGRALELLQQAREAGQEWLDTAQTMVLLEAYGIRSVPTFKARDDDEAVALAQNVGFPVALKILSPQAVHKSDVGGVALGLATAEQVRAEAAAMRARLLAHRPGATVLGFTVQPMVRRPAARELIAGIACDPVFGPVVLFGEGGTTVELRRGHAIALPPLNAVLAQDLVQRSGCAPLLAAWRGRPAVDGPALQAALQRVAQMACDLAPVAELDINPLLADEAGVLALDARIRLHAPGSEPPQPAIRPYPLGLDEWIEIAGQRLLVRPIRPEDGDRLQAFYAAASPADMRLRFFMARREIPHSELARYCQIDYDREMTFVALANDEPGGMPAMAGEVRAVCDPDNERAEFAIQIAGAWQRKGLGGLLMGKLLGWLRARGTREVLGQCLTQNAGMTALARELGFQTVLDAAGDSVTLRRAVAPAG